MRAVSTRVLPLPAPANISRGPSPCVTASCWGGFRRSSSAWTSGVSASSVGTRRTSLPAVLEQPVYAYPFVRLLVPLTREVDFGMRDHLLYELARDLSSSLELEEVLRKVIDRVITLMQASRGFVVLVDPITGTMSVEMSRGESDPEKASLFLGSRTVIEQVVKTGQAVVATDATLDDRFKGQQSVILQNLRSLFELHVNKQVTDYVLERSDRNTKFLPGERRQVTMLNSDIADFSSLSQTMGAEELVRFLNVYFSRMIEVVLEHGGNIDKFQGDGMLVVFGAPNPMTDHAPRALAAALAMMREVDRLNLELLASGLPPISVGIGLDTGEVVAGHVGSERRLEFTLMGVPVNNSSYLSKVRPAKVLMSETTRSSLPIGLEVVEYETLQLKGSSSKQAIYELQITVEVEE